MRRLYSNFAHGAPGAGLLLLRVVAGCALLLHGVAELTAGAPSAVTGLHMFCASLGVLIAVGLWMPAVGAVAAVDAAMHALFSVAGAGYYVLLSTLCAALALLGPGAWSIDARLFGWKRLHFAAGERAVAHAREKATGEE